MNTKILDTEKNMYDAQIAHNFWFNLYAWERRPNKKENILLLHAVQYL